MTSSFTFTSPIPHAAIATSSNVPQRRVPANSVAVAKPRQQPMRITTQMSDAWMREHIDNTAQPRPQALTGRGRRPVADITLVQRFTLVYWDSDNTKPVTLIVDSECSAWPSWQLSLSPLTLDKLGTNITAVEVFSQEYYTWLEISLTFVHTLSTGCVVFLRRPKTACLDEQVYRDLFLLAPPVKAHLRYGMTAQRTSVLQKLRAQGPYTTVEPSPVDDDKVIVIDSRKRLVKEEADDYTTPMKRRRIDSILGSASQPIFIPASPSASSSSSPRTPSLSLAPLSPFSGSSTPVSDLRPRWPHGMYAVNMVHGMMQMNAKDLIAAFPDNSQRFEHIFGHPLKITTFNDQKRRWKKAGTALQAAVLAGGRTPTGLWAVVIKAVPLR